MALAGTTVMTSEPFGVPVAVNPSTQTDADVLEIDLDVAESATRVDHGARSIMKPTSKSPEAQSVSYTFSLKIPINSLFPEFSLTQLLVVTTFSV